MDYTTKFILILALLVFILYYYDERQENFSMRDLRDRNYLMANNNSVNLSRNNRDSNFGTIGRTPPYFMSVYKKPNDNLYVMARQSGRTRQSRKLY